MRKLLAVLSLLMLLSGCGAGTGPLIYYPQGADSPGDFALGSEVWAEAPEELSVEALVGRMLADPQTEELRRVFPEGVRLRDWRQEEGVLTLNFSEDYSALTGVELTLANYCAAYTCAQLEGVEAVAVTVEGQPLPEGSSGPFAPSDLLTAGAAENPSAHIDEDGKSH